MQRVIPVAIAFLLGVVLGALLLAPLLGPAAPEAATNELSASGRRTPASDSPGPAATPLAPLTAPTPALRPVPAPAPAPAGASADRAPTLPTSLAAETSQSRPSLLGGDAVGWLEVTVIDGEGNRPEDGDVYALRAGASVRPNDYAPFYGHLEHTRGAVRLRVPTGQPLDVGYVGPGGREMARDVVVDPGGRRSVTLQLRPGTPVTFTLSDRPPDSPLGKAVLTATLVPEETGDAAYHPGRNQQPMAWHTEFEVGDDLTVLSPPVPPARYEAVVSASYPSRKRKSSTGGICPFAYLADKEWVEPGGAVALRMVQMAQLQVVITASGSAHAVHSGAVICVPEKVYDRAYWLLKECSWAELRNAPKGLTVTQHLTPGHYRLEWGGSRAVRGSSASFELLPGVKLQRKVALRFGAAGGTGDPRTPFASENGTGEEFEEDDTEPYKVVVPPQEDPDPFDGASIQMHMVLKPNEFGEYESFATSVTSQDPDLPLGGASLKRLLPLVATRGAWLASAPMQPADPLRPVLQPAGLLILVLEQPPKPDSDDDPPPLTIERQDGAPLPYSESTAEMHGSHWTDYVAEETGLRVSLRLGTVLGPLPAGHHTFVVRRGDIVLGTVTAKVTERVIRALHIR